MRTGLLSFVCLFFLMTPCPAADLLGWQETRWGMTEAEAARALGKDGVRVSPPEQFKGLHVPLKVSMEISGSQVDALLQFSNETKTLRQVLLRSRFGGVETWAKFRDLLIEKYGSSIQVGKKREWRFKTTIIELMHLQVPGIIDQVTIRYFPASEYKDDKKML